MHIGGAGHVTAAHPGARFGFGAGEAAGAAGIHHPGAVIRNNPHYGIEVAQQPRLRVCGKGFG